MKRLLSLTVVLAGLLLWANVGRAAVVFDNFASTTVASDTTATTGSFTITSSSNRAAIVMVLGAGDLSSSITAVTVGGASGTLISGTNVAGNAGGAALYCVTAPASGSQTASVTVNSATGFTIGVITASGVDQTTPCNNGTNAFTNTATSISIPVTSNSGDLTVTTVYEFGGTSLTDNQTIKWSELLDGNKYNGGDIGSGTANPTHTWSGPSTFYTGSGANFNQASGGGSPDETFGLRRRVQ